MTSDRSAADTATVSGEALYLYCLARAGSLPALEGVGVDGEHPLGLITFRDVVAVVSTVTVDEFAGPAAEARMKDLAWVGSRVCRHHEAVEQAMRRSPVVPARFAVLFSSPDRLRAWLDVHQDAIACALDRFATHEEWSVKGTFDRRKGEASLLRQALEAERGAPSSVGARYLRERSARAAVGLRLDAWLGQARADIVSVLLEHAVEVRAREIVDGAPEEPGTPVANWAFLVSGSVVDEFAERIEAINAEYAGQGLTLHRSGPWPPYSFCPLLDAGPSA